MRNTSRFLLSLGAAAWAGGPLSAQAPAIDACSVLTREEITALSGRQDPGEPEPVGSGKVTSCWWKQTRPRHTVTLHANVDPKEPKGLALQQLLDRGMKARAVDGLGDDAVFLEAEGGTPSGTLFVRVGQFRLVMTRTAEADGAAASTLPTLTALAKAAIPKLRP